jgi:hypothetical protein
MTAQPIACTLTSTDYADRLAWIGTLNRESLRSHRQIGATLELVYDPTASARVRELVRREEKCCAFLRFSIDETSDAIHLLIQAPPEARDSAAALTGTLFAPFLARS